MWGRLEGMASVTFATGGRVTLHPPSSEPAAPGPPPLRLASRLQVMPRSQPRRFSMSSLVSFCS
jgi:hypothetical protein